jgi:hypothetical protein
METRNPFYYWHSRPKRQRRRKRRDPEIWRDDPDDPAIPDREDPACWFHFAELLSDETLNRALQRWQIESLRDTGVTGADEDEVDAIKPIRFHAVDGTVMSAVDCLLQCILRCGQHGASSSVEYDESTAALDTLLGRCYTYLALLSAMDPTTTAVSVDGSELSTEDCWSRAAEVTEKVHRAAPFHIATALAAARDGGGNDTNGSITSALSEALQTATPRQLYVWLAAAEVLRELGPAAKVTVGTRELSSVECSAEWCARVLTDTAFVSVAKDLDESSVQGWEAFARCFESRPDYALSIDGGLFCLRTCRERLVQLAPASSAESVVAWQRLIAAVPPHDAVEVLGERADATGVAMMYLEASGRTPHAWTRLALALSARCPRTSAVIDDEPCDVQRCLLEAYQIAPDDTSVLQLLTFHGLSNSDVVTLGGEELTRAQAAAHVARLQPRAAAAWATLGTALMESNMQTTITVGHRAYSATECFVAALNASAMLADAWLGLARCFSSAEAEMTIRGRPVTQAECFEFAVMFASADYDRANVLSRLGDWLRLQPPGKHWMCVAGRADPLTPRDCWLQAIKICPRTYDAERPPLVRTLLSLAIDLAPGEKVSVEYRGQGLNDPPTIIEDAANTSLLSLLVVEYYRSGHVTQRNCAAELGRAQDMLQENIGATPRRSHRSAASSARVTSPSLARLLQ